MSNSTGSLQGKRVVVIGGATGIGYAIAELATELGASAVIGSTNAANVGSAVKRIDGAKGYTVDLRDDNGIESFFEQVGTFDHLAITAGDWGGPMFASTKDLDLVKARSLFDVRFWGALGAAKHSLSKIAVDGSITFTSGMLAHRPRKGAPMAAVVGGVTESLTRGLAVDIAPIRVNAVCPGLVLTEQTKKMPGAMLQAMVEHLPLPRGGTPTEAAHAYVYFMLNSYATGQILAVEGGGLLV